MAALAMCVRCGNGVRLSLPMAVSRVLSFPPCFVSLGTTPASALPTAFLSSPRLTCFRPV